MKYIVACGDAGERLDALSARVFNISRSAAARLIECGDITVNDTIREKKHSVTEGEEICLVEREPEPSEILAEKIPLDIIFEDERLTSEEAEQRLRERKIDFRKNKGLVDMESACVILEQYLGRR